MSGSFVVYGKSVVKFLAQKLGIYNKKKVFLFQKFQNTLRFDIN